MGMREREKERVREKEGGKNRGKPYTEKPFILWRAGRSDKPCVCMYTATQHIFLSIYILLLYTYI